MNACLYKPGRVDFVPALSPILEFAGCPFLRPFRFVGLVLHLVLEPKMEARRTKTVRKKQDGFIESVQTGKRS